MAFFKRKKAANDFTEDDLPKNRKEVFKVCFKDHYDLMFRIGLISLLFALPMLFTTVVKDVTLYNNYGREDFNSVLRFVGLTTGFFQMVATVIIFAGLSGIMHVMRQLVWDEPVFFGSDFKDGFKMNKKSFILIGIVWAFIQYLVQMMSTFEQLSTLFIIESSLLYVIVTPIVVWALFQNVVYKLNFTQTIKNSFVYYVKTAPITILFILLLFLPIVMVNLINIFIVKYGVIIVCLVFYWPIVAVAWFLYACSKFDEMVNKNNYPEIYRKGLYGKPEEKK